MTSAGSFNQTQTRFFRSETSRTAAFLITAIAIVLVSARPYAGSWNDASTLATVESVVDYGTLAIDDSIFVRGWNKRNEDRQAPFPTLDPVLRSKGTQDKIQVGGRYYSDKSPVPALLMAGVYKGLQRLTGLRAARQPAEFCYWMTVVCCGAAYVTALVAMLRLARLLGLSESMQWAFGGSFGLSTLALTYTRHVNRHIMLLAIAAALHCCIVRLACEHWQPRKRIFRIASVGFLGGLAYTIDLGAGPILLLCTALLTLYRGGARSFAVFAFAATPWLVLHHVTNYMIAGTIKPANMTAAYLAWPGSPFTGANMTGFWSHSALGDFAIYALSLLFGKRGFLNFNLPMLLVLPGLCRIIRDRCHDFAEVVHALCWCSLTWLLYSAVSNNYSGECASVRWFLPLLPPMYYVLGRYLMDYPSRRSQFLVLSVWGFLLSVVLWHQGPWNSHLPLIFWPVQVLALMSWYFAAKQRRPVSETVVMN